MGLSQKQLAEKVGVARVCVTYWESDNCQGLSLPNAKKLAKIFDCSLIQLFGINNFKYKPTNDEDKLLLIQFLAKSIKDDKTRGDFLKCLRQNELQKK